MMPFSEEFDKVWMHLKKWIEKSIPELNIVAIRLDEVKGPGYIDQNLFDNMKNATFCIADITGNNPNVLWETGFCQALGKPIIHISQSLADIPFDLKHTRILEYSPSNLNKLKDEIQFYIKETLLYLDLLGEDALDFLITPEMIDKTIVVTGSMSASSSVKQRITSTLSLFLGKKIHWLCGSYGETDEHVVRFLSGHREKVKVVGYHESDISPKIQKLLKKRNIPFIDANSEKIPKLLSNKNVNKRDLYFLMKADLIILFWSKTSGTTHLIDWFMKQEKDVLVVNV